MAQSTTNAGDRWAAFRGLSWWQVVLALLPLALIAIGGLVGGAVGGGAAWANLKVAKSALPGIVKALLMLAMAVAAYFVWLVINVTVRSMLTP